MVMNDEIVHNPPGKPGGARLSFTEKIEKDV